MSAEIVNLRRVRKDRRRAEAADTASVNRAKFGRSRAERAGEAEDLARRDRHLDGHRLQPAGTDGEPA